MQRREHQDRNGPLAKAMIDMIKNPPPPFKLSDDDNKTIDAVEEEEEKTRINLANLPLRKILKVNILVSYYLIRGTAFYFQYSSLLTRTLVDRYFRLVICIVKSPLKFTLPFRWTRLGIFL
jgi:hypothetical protein